MQLNKFQRAANLIRKDQPTTSTPNNSVVMSPKCVRSGSREYYKRKYEQAMNIIHNMSDESINLEVAGVVRLTQ